MTRLASSRLLRAALLPLAVAAATAGAQPATGAAAAPPSPTVAPDATADPLADFGWLDGCWRGSVNQRDFREHWMAPQGGMLLGVSQVVMGGKTVGYEYLKIETRPDGVYYVAVPSDAKEAAFRYAGMTIDTAGDRGDRLYAFENPALEFPRRIVYRHATGGWLYAQVEGKVSGADRQVIYPMRHVDCATGALLQK
jgi:uncharacterized protein DUF6265